ncbi:MAG: A/G-specific adenine glycosylase [Verrucomicrobiota bacterium]
MPHQRTIAAIVSRLLKWYPKHARDLPWRRTTDPYCVYVSEVMLQQTQVKTVIPYWERWLRELPTVRALAEAEPDRVLKLWEGLGYYHRARNLQKAARCIMEQHGGRFPENYEAILALPGIGRYTAGAICSIAFNQPVPILDGNVIRVLARVFCLRGDPAKRAVQLTLWGLAGQLVNAAGKFRSVGPELPLANCHSFLNQSLMELGALVCTPRQPQCSACPIQPQCLACQHGLTDQLPAIPVRAKPIQRRHIVLLLARKGRLLIHRRPAGGVNDGFWQFPEFEAAPKAVIDAPFVLQQSGFQLRNLAKVANTAHSITRYRLRLEAFRGILQVSDFPSGPDWRWVARRELESLPFSAAHRKLLLKLDGWPL